MSKLVWRARTIDKLGLCFEALGARCAYLIVRNPTQNCFDVYTGGGDDASYLASARILDDAKGMCAAWDKLLGDGRLGKQ